MEPKANPEVTDAMESDLLRSVHAILLELDGHHTASQFNRGMLRWTLHKKIERNPTNNSTLVKIVVKELERAERSDNKLHIIPLLHTLMYAIVQAKGQDTIELCFREVVATVEVCAEEAGGNHSLYTGRLQQLYTTIVSSANPGALSLNTLQKRDARRPFLTQKLSLQIYYIPVTQEEYSFTKENTPTAGSDLCQLAAYLGRVDPWYENNIRSLCQMIPKLAKMKSCSGKSSEANPFLTDVISYYVRMGLQPVYFCIYSVKMAFTCLTKEHIEDVFVTQLQIDIPECMGFSGNCGAMMTISYKKASLSNREVEKGLSLRTSGLVMRAIPTCETEDLDCLTVSFSEGSKDGKIRTCNIKIRTLERKPFTVCLDQDYRRIFKNVASIEVSPCLEPGYVMQKMQNSRFSVSDQEDVGLTKYMSKVLPLPINTFAGIIQ
ncbi:UNVERIFIED_CONTAM: hypothetical protein FKN15_068115 [Acipenser sinensis]